MLGFLVEVLEKGPSTIQSPVLTIIHCLLHYVDMTSATQTINSDLLRTVAKFVEVIIVLNQFIWYRNTDILVADLYILHIFHRSF